MSGPPFSRTFVDLVREQAQRAPASTALVCAQGRFTYTQLAQRADRVAGALRAAGVRHGDRVGLLLANRVEWIDLCLGAAAAGATVVPLSTWSTRSELAVLIEDAGLALLAVQARFGERNFEADLQALQGKAGMPAIANTWVLDTINTAFTRFDAALQAATAVSELPPGEAASAGDDALVLYTSGSTSAPKAVPLSQHAVLENGFNIGERQGLTAADRVLLTSPLFWAYGGCNALPATFTHGATLVLLEKFDAEEVMQTIERERCTAFYTLPAMTAALARHPNYRRERMASMRTGLTIGSPEDFFLAAKTLDAAELCNIYGATETCGNCCVTWHHWPLQRRAHCQGPPLPGQRVRFVDEDTGAAAAPGTPGLTEVLGFTTRGYTGASAEQNSKAFAPDGWYRTGDLGMLNAEGDFVFVGRVSEMIKRAGINVSPAEVEAVLRRHPSVDDAAVVGVPDAARGELIYAFVVAKAGVAFDPAELLRHCASEASKYKLPDHIEPLAGMPLTVTGKLQRRELKQCAIERAAALAASAAPVGSS